MIVFIWNLALAVVWAAINERFSLSNLVLGYLLGYGILWFLQPVQDPSRYFLKVRQSLGFLLFFGREMIVANLRVAYEVLTPSHTMKPGVIAIPLDTRGDLELTLLTILITLTPGTLSLDVAEDGSVLFLSALHVEDPQALRREIKEGFERRLLELLR